MDHRIVLNPFRGRCLQAGDEILHFALKRDGVALGRAHRLEKAGSALQRDILTQIGDTSSARLVHRAEIRAQFTDEDAKERRLAHAVAPHNSATLARLEREGDIPQDGDPSVVEGDSVEAC